MLEYTYVSAQGEVINAHTILSRTIELFDEYSSKDVVRLLNEITMIVNECHLHDEIVNRAELIGFIANMKDSVKEAVQIHS